MKYTIYPKPATQEQRAEFNRKLLMLIDNKETEKYQVSGDDVYNAYTGDGGLHGLKRGDYDNYHSYSKDKKEIENGQFFTPPKLAKLVVDCIGPTTDETIADLTCGAGAFFNFLPNEHNIYGCEVDIKAYKVARFLYPDANIENKDIRSYKPMVRFDYVIGNPPFNLKWWVDGDEEIKSQLYFCQKAASLLKPKGIMAIIVPESFLSDDFANSSDITLMEEHFNFLGQISLPADSFAAMGVSSFATKLQFWQKKSETDTEDKPYSRDTAFIVLKNCNYDEVSAWVDKNLLSNAKSELRRNKYGILREIA
ncbi:MAG: SAM-dependent DNA methyltransferase, partial [Clostridia bacterium]|nr:SAM-dependent DNA methyltransferase [Clostridia bacterium]